MSSFFNMKSDIFFHSLFITILLRVVPADAQTNGTTPSGDPYALRVVNTTTHGILITWRDPVPVQSYRVSATPVDGVGRASDGNLIKVKATAETTHAFDYITPFTNYTLKVEALTSDKTVPAVRTVTAATKQYSPNQVENVYLQATTDSITVHWTEPTKKNGIIEEYYIVAATNMIIFNTTVNATVRNYVIKDGIKPYTSYAVSVRAKTAYPEWGPLKADVIKTLQTRPSGSPSYLNFTSLSPHSVTLLWEEINKEERNGEIIGYNVSYAQNGQVQFIQTDQETLQIDTLFPSTSYTFEVRGYVKINEKLLYGPASAVSITTLPKTDVPEISQSSRDRWLVKDRLTHSQIRFVLPDDITDIFTLENGAIYFYQILAVAANSNRNIRKEGNDDSSGILLTWRKAEESDFTTPYAIAPRLPVERSWNISLQQNLQHGFHSLPNFRKTEDKIVTVGNEECGDDISDYCNGPLLSSTDYCIYLRGWTKADYFMDSDCLVQTRTKHAIVPIIVAIAVSAIIVIVLTTIGVVFYRRRCRTSQRSPNRVTHRANAELPTPPLETDNQEEYESVDMEEGGYITIPAAGDENHYKNISSEQPRTSAVYVTDAYIPITD